jgi:hypothetical protein
VRAAAARAQCQNNLKNLALAARSYHDAHGALPPASVEAPGLAVEDRLSWMVELMPYLEREKEYRALDRARGWQAQANQGPLSITYRMVRCASLVNEPVEGLPETSYVGVAGVGADAATLPLSDPRCGVFGHGRRVTVADVKDGESNTLLALETARAPGPWAAGGEATVRAVDPETQPYVAGGGPFGREHWAPDGLGWGRRRAEAPAAFVDGSVRVLDGKVAPGVLEAMATIAGGEGEPE